MELFAHGELTDAIETAHTARDGNLAFPESGDGRYLVRVSREGFITYTVPVRLLEKGVAFDDLSRCRACGTRYLPDQYIEVTGIADGYNILETTVDPDATLLEADETNNCGAVLTRLSGMGTATPTSELIGNGPPCQP